MIRLVNVCKQYGEGVYVQALRNASLHVAANDYIGILGPSGSGKSTLLHIMGLLDRPTSGEIFVKEKNIARLADMEMSHLRGRMIGFVFQSYYLISHLDAVENVALPLFYQGISAGQRQDKAKALLKKVRLSHRFHHRPNQLSGGECQRVAIARALAVDPPLLLADEPTGNLDSESGIQIMSIFDELHQQGKTIVIITHDAHVAGHAKRIINITDGLLTENSPS
jgi:putative ABC transport system ATP-binding protein